MTGNVVMVTLSGCTGYTVHDSVAAKKQVWVERCKLGQQRNPDGLNIQPTGQRVPTKTHRHAGAYSEIKCLINTETKYPNRLTLNLNEMNNTHALSVHIRELIRLFVKQLLPHLFRDLTCSLVVPLPLLFIVQMDKKEEISNMCVLFGHTLGKEAFPESSLVQREKWHRWKSHKWDELYRRGEGASICCNSAVTEATSRL